MATVQFDGIDRIHEIDTDVSDYPPRPGIGNKGQSTTTIMSAPAAPPHEHGLGSIPHGAAIPEEIRHSVGSIGDVDIDIGEGGPTDSFRRRMKCMTFGTLSKRAAFRQIRQENKRHLMQRKGWSGYDPNSSRWTLISRLATDGTLSTANSLGKSAEEDEEECGCPPPDERTSLMLSSPGGSSRRSISIVETEGKPWVALKEMFTENKINVLFVFLPLAWWAHVTPWSDGSIFIITFLAMVPLASMLGVFTEELAAQTNDVLGGLINATFGNAVEMVVAIQALLANDFLVVQASLIGSVFSNLLLVLGMCFLAGGVKFPEQEFVAEGAVASIALLAFNGLTMLMPEFFSGDGGGGEGGAGGGGGDGADGVELKISRIGAVLLVLLYVQLLYFQLKTHVHLFEGDGDVIAMIPFSWALIGLVLITAVVTILSEWLVASIDGFCEEFALGRSFVGVIILPVVGNAVEHISAVTVAMKNKMDLALGVALGSSVQIALFVMPMLVLIGWSTDRDLTLRFPRVEVYLYLMSVIIVSLCLSNQRSNWMEGSLLVFTYVMIAVGMYFEGETS